MNSDDERLGQLFRLLRRRSGLTQEDLSIATSIPVRDIQRLEDGRAERILFGRVRRLFADLDARTRINVWWKGAAADRLLDERHAAIAERANGVMTRYRWVVRAEFTYSEFGERGSIDLFGLREEALAVAICEVKSAIGSLEEMNRTLDAKVRLAPKLCRDQYGWNPRYVGRLLIVPDESTVRRIITAHRQTLTTLYPARGREIRTWLRKPDRGIAGIWFLSDPRNTRMDPTEAR